MHIVGQLLGALALAAFGATTAFAQAVVDGPEVNWKMSLWGNPRAFTAPVDKLSELIAERTGGKFKIEVVYGGQLAGPRENLDGLQVGAFQAAVIAPALHPGKNPLAMGMDLPFLPIPDLETRQKVLEAYYAHPATIAEWTGLNVHRAYTILSPQFEFMGTGDVPDTIDKWEGKRVRAAGGLGEAMSKLGASAVTLGAPEVYPSLERGVLDAAAFPFTYAHGAYGLHEIADWYTTNMQPGVNHGIVLFNLDAWNALPQAYRDVVESAKEEAYAYNITAMRDADEKWLPIFEEAGMTPITYAEEDKARWIASAAKPVWDAWVAEQEKAGRPGQELLDLIIETTAQ